MQPQPGLQFDQQGRVVLRDGALLAWSTKGKQAPTCDHHWRAHQARRAVKHLHDSCRLRHLERHLHRLRCQGKRQRRCCSSRLVCPRLCSACCAMPVVQARWQHPRQGGRAQHAACGRRRWHAQAVAPLQARTCQTSCRLPPACVVLYVRNST